MLDRKRLVQDAYDHMARQGFRQCIASRKDGGACLYRKGKRGKNTACAIGGLVPDRVAYAGNKPLATFVGSVLNLDFPEVAMRYLTKKYNAGVKFTPEERGFVSRVQMAHDGPPDSRTQSVKQVRANFAALMAEVFAPATAAPTESL